jgi:hypothetical protein
MQESKSQRKRAAFDYRYEYFRKNPGLFGCIWFCGYCGIPIIGKSGVQVDHVIPLAGMGINRTFNTIAACPRCNRLKSDKGGLWIVRGSIAKVFEVVLFTTQKVVLQVLVAILRILHTIGRALISVLFAPIKYGSGTTKVILIFVYLIILLLLLKSCSA